MLRLCIDIVECQRAGVCSIRLKGGDAGPRWSFRIPIMVGHDNKLSSFTAHFISYCYQGWHIGWISADTDIRYFGSNWYISDIYWCLIFSNLQCVIDTISDIWKKADIYRYPIFWKTEMPSLIAMSHFIKLKPWLIISQSGRFTYGLKFFGQLAHDGRGGFHWRPYLPNTHQRVM